MTDTHKPVAAIKARPDEAQGEPLNIRSIPFYSHLQLGASVSLIGFRGDTPMYAMQRTTST